MSTIPESIAAFAEAMILQASAEFVQARAAADRCGGAAGAPSVSPEVARQRVEATGGDLDALRDLCAGALVEAEWWRMRRRQPGGRFTELFRAELARFGGAGDKAAEMARRIAELEAECAALRAAPAPSAVAPVAAGPEPLSAEAAISELVECRVLASIARAEAWGRELAAKWVPYSPEEVGHLRAVHRFMVLHGLADAVDTFPMPGAAPSRVSNATGLPPAPVPAARPAAPVAAAPAAPKGRVPRAAKPKQEAAEEQNALFG